MLNKDSDVKWTTEARASFEEIKKAITEAPILVSPDFTKEFKIFSFASEHTIATVLLQKNDKGYEQPIAFFQSCITKRRTEIHHIGEAGLRDGKII